MNLLTIADALAARGALVARRRVAGQAGARAVGQRVDLAASGRIPVAVGPGRHARREPAGAADARRGAVRGVVARLPARAAAREVGLEVDAARDAAGEIGRLAGLILRAPGEAGVADADRPRVAVPVDVGDLRLRV